MSEAEIKRIFESFKVIHKSINDLKQEIHAVKQPVAPIMLESYMQSSDAVDLINAAFVKAQSEFTVPVLDKQAQFGKIASPSSLINSIRPALNKNGISLKQPLSFKNGNFTLTTRIDHVSGQYMQETIICNPAEENNRSNNIQRLGASITYLRRYTLCSFFGISTNDNEDYDIISK